MIFTTETDGSDQTLMAPSWQPVTNVCPSGLMASADIGCIYCPGALRVCVSVPSGNDHSSMVPSAQPTASSRPSGLKARE
jgi:hypothetical protein